MSQAMNALERFFERLHRWKPPDWLRKTVRVVVRVLLVLLILLVILVVLLQTPMVKRWLAGLIEDILSESLALELEIGELSGSLLGDATLSGFSIANPPGSREPRFLSIDECSVEFNLFEAAFGTPQLRLAQLTGVRVVYEAYADGGSNIELLFPPSEPEKPNSPLVIENIRLIGGDVTVLAADGSSFTVGGLSGSLGLEIESELIHLSELDFHGALDDLDIPAFWVEGSVRIEDAGPLRLERMTVATLGSLMRLEGSVYPDEETLDLELVAPNVSLDELRETLDPGLPLAGGVEVRGHLSGPFSDPRAEMDLALRNPNAAGYLLDELAMRGVFSQRTLYLDDFRLRRGGGRAKGWAELDFNGEQPSLAGQLNFYGIDPAELAPTHAGALPGDLNGRLRLESVANEPGEHSLELELFPGELGGVDIQGVKLAALGDINDLTLTRGLIRVAGGRLNLTGGLRGGELELKLRGGDLRLAQLRELTGLEGLAGRGDLSLDVGGPPTEARIRYGVQLRNTVYDAGGVERLSVEGVLQLPLERRDALDAVLSVDNGRYKDYGVERARVEGRFGWSAGPSFDGRLQARGLSVNEERIAELELTGDYAEGEARLEDLRLIYDDQTRLGFAGRLSLTETGFDAAGERLELEHNRLRVEIAEPFVVALSDSSLELEPLTLVSNAGELRLAGHFELEEERFDFDAASPGLDLGVLGEAVALTDDEELGGRAVFSLTAMGSPQAPIFDLELDVDDFVYGEQGVERAALDAELTGGVALSELLAALDGTAPLRTEVAGELGRVELEADGLHYRDFALDGFTMVGALNERELQLESLTAELGGANIDAAGRLGLDDAERPLRLAFGAHGFPLDELPFLPPGLEFDGGELTVEGLVEGSLNEPRIQGTGKLIAERVIYDEAGVELTDLDLRFAADPREVRLLQLAARLGEGRLSGDGVFEYADTQHADFQLTGDGLEFRNLADLFTGSCDLDVRFVSDEAGPRLNGRVEVLEGNIDVIMGGGVAVGKRTPPGKSAEAPLDVSLEIVAERNLWVRSEMIDLEVSANLKLTLLGEELALGGRLNTVRGSVYFLDKAFDIDEGTIAFGRRIPPDPDLNIEASTRIRSRDREGAGEEMEIGVGILGTLSNPEVVLTSDPALPERDIIMLIAMDMTWDEYQGMLGDQGAGGAAGHAGGQAAMVLAGFIQNKLRRLAREAAGLDTLKVESALGDGGDFDSLNVTVGKYLLRDLYVSYSRDVLNRGNQSLAVEYFITDNLSAIGQTTEEEGEMTYQLNLKWKLKY